MKVVRFKKLTIFKNLVLWKSRADTVVGEEQVMLPPGKACLRRAGTLGGVIYNGIIIVDKKFEVF